MQLACGSVRSVDLMSVADLEADALPSPDASRCPNHPRDEWWYRIGYPDPVPFQRADRLRSRPLRRDGPSTTDVPVSHRDGR